MKSTWHRSILWTVCAAAVAFATPGSAQTASPTTLHVASFGGKIDDVFKEIFAPFEKEHNVTIRWVPAAAAENAAKAVAVKGTPEFDIILTDNQNFPAAARQGAFRKIDVSKVTNYEQLFDDAKMSTGDGAALGFYYSGFFYNSTEFAARGWEPPTRWADVLKPEFCNSIGLPHPNLTYGLDVPYMLVDASLKDMSEGIAKYGQLKDCVAVLEPSASKMEEKIQLGEYVTGIYISMRVIGLAQSGYPVVFRLPEDGTFVASGVIALPVGSQNPDLADQFMNWLLAPESQKLVVEKIGYSPANKSVEIPAEMAKVGIPTGEQLSKIKVMERSELFNDKRRWIREIESAFTR